MVRYKLGATAMVALLAFGGVVVTGGSASAVPLPKAIGNVTCVVSGTGKFSPKLTPTGVATTAVKTTFKGVTPTSGGCSGSASIPNSAGSLTPVTIFGATFKGAGYYSGVLNANSCPVFSTIDGVGVIKMKITWASAPAIAPTVLTFASGGPAVTVGATDTITLPSGATIAATGSFSAPPPPAILAMVTNIVGVCSATWGPYAHYTFGVGSSLSV